MNELVRYLAIRDTACNSAVRPICTATWLQLVLLALAHCWLCQIWSGYWEPIDCSCTKLWGLFSLGIGFQQERCSLTFSTASVPKYPVLEHGAEAMAEWSHLMSGRVQTEPGVTACVQCHGSFWFDPVMLTKLSPVSLQSTVGACKLPAPAVCKLPDRAWPLLGRVLAGLRKNYTRGHSNNI